MCSDKVAGGVVGAGGGGDGGAAAGEGSRGVVALGGLAALGGVCRGELVDGAGGGGVVLPGFPEGGVCGSHGFGVVAARPVIGLGGVPTSGLAEGARFAGLGGGGPFAGHASMFGVGTSCLDLMASVSPLGSLQRSHLYASSEQAQGNPDSVFLGGLIDPLHPESNGDEVDAVSGFLHNGDSCHITTGSGPASPLSVNEFSCDETTPSSPVMSMQPQLRQVCVGYSSSEETAQQRKRSKSFLGKVVGEDNGCGSSGKLVNKSPITPIDTVLQEVPNQSNHSGHGTPNTNACIHRTDQGTPNPNATSDINVHVTSNSNVVGEGSGTAMCPLEEAMRRRREKDGVIFKPSLGKIFASIPDAYQFYNLYSWEVGFSIRRSKNQDGKQRNMQEFRCQRAGKPPPRKRSTTMCNCPARMRILRNDQNQWYVKIFEEEHNHELVESCGEKQHLKSHQSIDQATRNLVRYLRENNVSLGKVNSVLGSMHGGQNNLTFNKKLLKTVCADIARDLVADDMQKTMKLLCSMRAEDPNFVFTFQMDDECRITALMWSSGSSRKMYSDFGDVVTFDTTYKTNIYDMPFGMFVGVSNHFRTMIFAGVLLTSETTESFRWAFKSFVEMMGGKAPVTMLTDQCPAMGAALRIELPLVAHRWCKWHVLKKVIESLGHIFNKYKSFQDDLNKVLNHMLGKQEFEDGWNALLVKYGLTEHAEMRRAFESRELWAKPWFTEVFCARMTSTQRSESTNGALKGLVPRNSPMHLFVQQYTGLVIEQQRADYEQEKTTKQRQISLTFGWPIEAHAASVYTKAAYELFVEELRRATAYVIVKEEGDVFEIKHQMADLREKWSKVDFTVTVDAERGVYSCECGLYSHFGMLCAHALLVMVTRKGLKHIPEAHIMTRWTRKARLNNPAHLVQVEKPAGAMQSKVFRHNMLESAYREVAKLADADREYFDIALKTLGDLRKTLQEKKDSLRINCQVGYETSGSDIGGSVGSDSEVEPLQIFDSTTGVAINLSSIKPPLLKSHIGRPTNARYKSANEAKIRRVQLQKKRARKQGDGGSGAPKQSRHCKKCRKRDHDIRTCPEAHKEPAADCLVDMDESDDSY